MVSRRKFTSEFKSKVALEALREECTLSELATRYDIHPNMIRTWKRHALDNMAGLFTGKSEKHQANKDGEIKDLHAKIGQLTIENDFLAKGLQTLSRERRKAMIEPSKSKLSIKRQCELVSISRSSFYHTASGESPLNLLLMRLIDEQFMETPYYGSRQMARHLRRAGHCVSRKRVRRLMRKIGLWPIYQKPRTSIRHPQHKVYPYLLRGLDINRANQVWSTDITYIPMKKGFLYLVAIIDWYSRKVLSWRLSNSMDVSFCLEALKEAITLYGKPDIFNTDQGSQFTSFEFTNTLKEAGIRISMDGKGCWVDNVFIERLWRSLKYECIYLHVFETGSEVRRGINKWMQHYNGDRPHSSLDGATPDEVYSNSIWGHDPIWTKAA
ncbi:MAG: IS3 family transposase [Emcibacter sp.]|nr:IS3 family transposase [Emcibacter sp.]